MLGGFVLTVAATLSVTGSVERADDRESASSETWITAALVLGVYLVGIVSVTWMQYTTRSREAGLSFLNAVLDNTREGVVACDSNGTLALFNNAAQEFHGKAVAHLPPEQWSEHFDLFEADAVTPLQEENIPLSRALRGELVEDQPMVIAPRNLPLRFITANGQQILDKNGRVLGAVVTMNDVTEFRTAEAKRLESDERFDGAFDAAAHGIAIVGTDGQWLEVNKALCDIVGYSREELLATDFQSITHPDDLDKDLDLLASLADNQIQSYQMEKRYFHKNGHEVWILLSVSAVRGEDKSPKYFVSQIQDLTTQKQAEQQRVEQHKLEIERTKAIQDNVAKSAFLAHMSHELRTPLNAIIGYAELVSEDLEADDSEHAMKDLARIKDAGRHLLNLVNDVLDLSKVESGRIQLNLSSFDLRRLLEEMLEVVRLSAQENDNRLMLEIDDCFDDKITIYSDELKIKQILLNLLSNAAKFTQTGLITISLTRESEGTVPGFVLSVEDTGTGMTEHELSGIFEPFAQAGTAASQGKGTGLGLAITNRFCDALQGSLRVSSKKGSGSRFEIWLPRNYDASSEKDGLSETPKSV